MFYIILKDGRKYLVTLENLPALLNHFPGINFTAEFISIWVPQGKKEAEPTPALIPLSNS